MNCPRCVPHGGLNAASPYRGELRRGEAPQLVAEVHPSGVNVARCPVCRGAFVEWDALVKIDGAAQRRRRQADPERFRRGFAPPTESIACPSCHGETTKREWSIGTLIFIDVCVECRGVWLDHGELELIE